eukprot:TRINITY_DN28657_c0_g1_i1.p1 TRINITY_DN28657_c0_g1~~TRINITY_DN28657_c0_g1_i1.p1  ORF type:complete len:337 (-),score=68.29 TRINITY_DN28657_c0_g1_i1:9-1019(-)
MPCVESKLIDALMITAPPKLQARKFGIASRHHRSYRMTLGNSDQWLKEVAERREQKQRDKAAHEELEDMAKGDVSVMEMMNRSDVESLQKEATVQSSLPSSRPELGKCPSQEQKPRAVAVQQAEKDVPGKSKQQAPGARRGRGRAKRLPSRNCNEQGLPDGTYKDCNASWQPAYGNWETQPAQPSQSPNCSWAWHANTWIQQADHDSSPARYDRTPSPPSPRRQTWYTDEGHTRMANLLQQMQQTQHTQFAFGCQFQGGGCIGYHQAGSQEIASNSNIYLQQQSPQPWQAECCNRSLQPSTGDGKTCGNRMQLVEFQPFEYGTRDCCEGLEVEDEN